MKFGNSAIGVALTVALICFGMLIGLSLAVLSQAFADERLFRLALIWGPAIGSGIGASATIAAAIYNQGRVERREQRGHISRISYALAGLDARLVALQTEVASVVEEAKNGRGPDLTSVLVAANAAWTSWDQIEPPHELPSETQALIYRALMAARPPGASRLLYLPSAGAPGSPEWIHSASNALDDIARGREAIASTLKRLELLET